jgi:hypothetical protein
MIKHSLFNRSIAVVLIISLLQSCNYYKLTTANIAVSTSAEVITKNQSNYIIVHLGDNIWQLDGAIITTETVTGYLSKMTPKAAEYYRKAVEDNNYRVEKDNTDFISQLHLHVEQFKKSDNTVTFKTSDITKIDVMKMDGALTTLSKVATPLLIIAGAVGAFAIFLAVVCGCPHAYTFDGTSYHYNNTLFTGATSENMERDDYKGMPDYNPESEDYSMIIKNEENEIQYTNLLELIVVNHNSDVDVVTDQNGTIYALKNQIQPTTILDDNGADLANILAYNDDLGHSFDNSGESDYKNVYATFNKPEDASNAKLVLKATNTRWSGFVHKEFSKLFGKYYDNWVKKNHKKSKDEVMASLKKTGIPMVVSVKKGNQWIDIETIDLIGEVNYNSLVVPIDASLLEGEQIEVRIRSGFMFWDLDYVNIDFTPTTELDVQHLSPTSVTGTNSNHQAALSNDDDLYMEHLRTGDSANILFTGLKPAAANRTIFLHSKGYYIFQEVYEGKLQTNELAKINKDAGMSAYSERLFNKVFLNYAINLK